MATLSRSAVTGTVAPLPAITRAGNATEINSYEEGPPAAARNISAIADRPNPPSMRLSPDAKLRPHRDRRLLALCARRLRRDDSNPLPSQFLPPGMPNCHSIKKKAAPGCFHAIMGGAADGIRVADAPSSGAVRAAEHRSRNAITERRCLTSEHRNDAVRAAQHQHARTTIDRRNRSDKCPVPNLVACFKRRDHLNERQAIITPSVADSDVGERTWLARQGHRGV